MIAKIIFVIFLFTNQAFAETILPYYESKFKSGRELHYQDSEAEGYYKYVNPRFAYTFDVPKEFNYIVSIPGNSAGITIGATKKNAILYTSGHYLGATSGRDSYNDSIKTLGKKVTYSSFQTNSYVVIWLEPGDGLTHGDFIYYKKLLFDGKYFNQFTVGYPVAEKAYFEPIVTHMAKKFIPGWKTGFKIYG